ncbi:MAG: CBS domain-containing protein [Sedimentisphaerales bacterium]|nr:CBS domain-containing protein [Sedimentisphaerales bacterium]
MKENRDRLQHIELVENRIKQSCTTTLPATSRNWLEVGDIMTEDIATICPGASVVSAARIMSDKNISCIIVSDNEKISGIITETDLLKKGVAGGNDFRKMAVEQIMSSPVHSVQCNLSVLETGQIMENKKIRRLIVLEKERLVGIITQTDIVRVLTSYSTWKDVSEIMTSDVAVIASTVTVKEAVEVMASEDISCVVGMDNNAVAGIFTERDLLKRVIAMKRDPAQIILKNVMSSPVVSVPANYSIPSASKAMEKMGIRRVVVMENEILQGVITQTDILKAMKKKLQEEEENYFRLLGKSNNCIFVVDLNHNTIFVNPALIKLLEVTNPEELINKPFLPERFWDNPREREYILGQLKKASVEVHDLTMRTAKGNKLFVTLFLTRTKNIKGQTSGSQGVLYDITAKKELATLREMEQKLRRSEALLRGTLESTADGILVIGEEGRISHINNPFIKIWDVPEEIYNEENDHKLFEHIDGLLENSSVFIDKLKAPCPDDQNSSDILHLKEGKILEVSSLPLIREGKFAGQVWSFHDITKQKRAEEVLHKAHDELEVRVEQRTAELASANKVLESEITDRKNAEQALLLLNKDLEATISELQRTNKELKEFAHITAHDLKTPLRGIVTLADWLSTDYADKFDEEGRKQITMLAKRAKRADKLVDSILRYSNAGHDNEEHEQMDLNTALPEIICEIEPPENIEITVENKLPVLMCQKTHISQIFQNIFSNAIKYMDKEKGQIKVGCIDDGDFWKFSIADNGPGIDHKYFKKIFKIFQTLSPPDETESTGIGLSVAKKLVKLNDGRIWVKSNPGEGCTFFFSLPKSDVKQEVPAVENQEVRTP